MDSPDLGFSLVAILVMLCASVALPWVVPYAGWNAAFMFVFGGTFAALYIIPLTLLGRRFKGADLSAAASVFSVMFCFGALAGPPLAGVGMTFLGNDGMRFAVRPAQRLSLYFRRFEPQRLFVTLDLAVHRAMLEQTRV